MMKTRISGPAFVLGDNVDTDQIIPAEHLVYRLSDPEERKLYGRHALGGVPADQSGLPDGGVPFVEEGRTVSPYRIIVAGRNFGCGSSREHAPFALREAGVEVVIAESYARIFYRNCVNGGYLAPVETPRRLCDDIRTGQNLEVDLEAGTLFLGEGGERADLAPLGDALPILQAGDVFAYARQSGMI